MTRVGVTEFVFVVQLTGCDQVDGVLGEVATNVFRHVGCTSAAVTELAEQLSSVITSNLVNAVDLQVAFHAHDDACDVIVTSRDREVWRTTHCLS
jgi:hypothetical protein